MASDPASDESGVREGMTIGSFSCALKCKLQPVECLTIIGTEGDTPPTVAAPTTGAASRDAHAV
jgi:hypothetical protein